MAIPSYKIQIITPQGVSFDGEVIHSRIPVEKGSVGVLANHAPYITSSAGGTLEVREPGGHEKQFEVGSGFFEVAHNRATFLTQSFNSETPPVK